MHRSLVFLSDHSPFFRTLFVFFVFILPSLPLSAQDHRDWTSNLGMYEVNVRQYTPEGTFEAFEEHLDRLEDLGVGILWLMPIHPIGEQNRLGSLGSYYSVKDYKDVNPEFGTLDDFEKLVGNIHDRDMYVILDWVPNHTAWDNYLTEEHPEWYLTESGEFIPPPETNWSDVIQLDHHNPDLLDYMIDAMLFWVDEYGVDGFRFDAVSHVLDMDFLKQLNEALKARKPDIFLLAEHYGTEWYDLGFDMTHGWWLYGFGNGILKDIADGGAYASDLYERYLDNTGNHPDDAWQLFFTSNHDENSWHGTTRELFGDAAEVFAVLTATMDGMPLIYSGQEAGLDHRLAFFDKDEIPWRDHPKTELYRTLLELRRNNRAMWTGEAGGRLQRIQSTDNTNIFAFIREKDGERVLVVANLSGQSRDIILPGSLATGTYRDIFTNETIILEEDAGLSLSPWDYAVFELHESTTGSLYEVRPKHFALSQNYPNPFNPSTTIRFQLPVDSDVQLEIFDPVGRRVTTLVDGRVPAGRHRISWDASSAGSGVYIAKLQAGGRLETVTMSLIR